MKRNSLSCRSVVVGLVVAAVSVVGAVAVPSGSVAATNQQRVVATSPHTGVTYSVIYSCMAQQPSAIATTPSEQVLTKLEFVRDGEVVREINDRVDFRFSDNRLNFQRLDIPSSVGTEGITFRLRDVFESQGGFNDMPPAFMTITPAPCPDYEASPTGAFQAIAPQRVLDTRPDQRVNYSGAKPAARTSVRIPASVMPDRPAGVVAVSLTVTLIQPEQRGFAQVYPAGQTEVATSSTVNTPEAGLNIANSAVVPVAADGSLSVYTSGRAHLAVDINGYFVAVSSDVAAGRLETVDPIRLLDTRADSAVNSTGAKPGRASTTTVDLTASESGLPAGATAAVVNITATRTSARGFVQAAASGDLVVGESSVLNVTAANQSVAGLSIVPVSADGKIDLFTLGGADLVVDLFGWFTGDDAEPSGTGLFVPLTPERIFDSRRATSMNPNTFTNDAGGCCSGSDASLGFASLQGRSSAVFLNATAIGQGVRGFVRVGGTTRSDYSTVNHPANGAVANAALVVAERRAALHNEGPRVAGTRPALAVDITGYFTA